jgi:hypothetical protein
MKFYDAFCKVLVTVLHITVILRVLTQVKYNSDRLTGKEDFLSLTHCEGTLPVALPSTIYVVLSWCLSILPFAIKLQVIRNKLIYLTQ